MSTSPPGRHPNVPSRRPWLLIEDDEIDEIAFRRAAEQAGFSTPIICCASIETALARLNESPRPLVVLLDLNLPGRSGLDAMPDLRTHGIPIVILTTSRDERDRSRAYAAGAAGYFSKPLDRTAYQIAMTALIRYWDLAEDVP